MNKSDRRSQRTREQLERALTELMVEKPYDSISVQDITDRANVGRTTFYAHFQSKTDLFLTTHFNIVARLGQDSVTLDELLAQEPPAYFVKFLEYIAGDRVTQLNLTMSQDLSIIIRSMRQHVAGIIERCLREKFSEKSSQMPFDVLANYLGGAQMELVSWWLESRSTISPQELASYYQRMQRSVLRDALQL